MARIHITQLVCPQRHAIMAAVWEEGKMTSKQAEDMIRAMMKEKGLNPWCSICASTRLEFEERVTEFMSFEEAAAPLALEAIKNLITHALFAHNPMNN